MSEKPRTAGQRIVVSLIIFGVGAFICAQVTTIGVPLLTLPVLAITVLCMIDELSTKR